jgi:hypothetical protein
METFKAPVLIRFGACLENHGSLGCLLCPEIVDARGGEDAALGPAMLGQYREMHRRRSLRRRDLPAPNQCCSNGQGGQTLESFHPR